MDCQRCSGTFITPLVNEKGEKICNKCAAYTAETVTQDTSEMNIQRIKLVMGCGYVVGTCTMAFVIILLFVYFNMGAESATFIVLTILFSLCFIAMCSACLYLDRYSHRLLFPSYIFSP